VTTPKRVLLLSGYEMGRQPLGIASPAAVCRRHGIETLCHDLSLEPLDTDELLRFQPAIALISTPMHASLRVGRQAAQLLRKEFPELLIVFHGFYAEMQQASLFTDSVADATYAGESEGVLAALLGASSQADLRSIEGLSLPGRPGTIPLQRQPIDPPDRTDLPSLERYARFENGQGGSRLVASIETTRGCKYMCRHCPIPPVYNGHFVAIDRDTILADIANVIEDGAQHLSFADADFLNGPTHALRVVRELHRRWPELTFDFTAKIEHLKRHADLLPELVACGARFVVSAVESLSPRVLDILDKGHMPDDVFAVSKDCRRIGLTLRPTFVAFTPWTTWQDYGDLLHWIAREDLVDHVDPVQWTIRLLVPEGSKLADHEAWLAHRGACEPENFGWSWKHPDPRMDRLQKKLERLVADGVSAGRTPHEIFPDITSAWGTGVPVRTSPPPTMRAPRITEPWFC
jgi:radical SAM superfamily enzyme YgiQ (UPF0313 family)